MASNDFDCCLRHTENNTASGTLPSVSCSLNEASGSQRVLYGRDNTASGNSSVSGGSLNRGEQ
jgi:hypothetical protein